MRATASAARSGRRSAASRSPPSSIDVPFWCYCAGNLAIVAAVVWWRAPRKAKETLPAERFTSAVRAGLRYVRHNRDMDATLIRAAAFFLFGSAYWALLPLVARSQMHNGAAITARCWA